jgi:choline dehydrogenase-like flavoprotein
LPVTHWLIVGGGTSGCVLAARLSEDPHNHVTLVEAGPEQRRRAASYLDDLAAPGAVWDGLVATDGDSGPRPYPQGRGLGGSSAVSGGVLSGELGDAGLDRLPVERRVVSDGELGAIDRALLASCSDATPALLSLASTAATYLAPARQRANLDVLTGALVDRVHLERRRAAGVVMADGAVLAADRVVCAAGAIHSPTLLLRSQVETAGIGDGLCDHAARVIELTLRDDVDVDVHGLVTGTVLRRGRVEIVAMNHLGDAQPRTAALLVGLLSSQRRGTVRLSPTVPGDPAAPPAVDFGHLGEGDTVRLATGVELAEELLTTRSFADVVTDFRVADGFGGYAHATSTCAMGRVVDEHGAVSDYEGLYVCDASVFPVTPPSGTLLPVVVLAERLSRVWAATER